MLKPLYETDARIAEESEREREKKNLIIDTQIGH